MVRSSKSLQFHVEEHFPEIVPQSWDAFYMHFNICPSLHPRGSASHECSSFTQSCYWLVDKWPNKLSSASPFVFTFPAFCCCVAAIKVKMSWCFPWNSKMTQFQHLLCSYVFFWNWSCSVWKDEKNLNMLHLCTLMTNLKNYIRAGKHLKAAFLSTTKSLTLFYPSLFHRYSY